MVYAPISLSFCFLYVQRSKAPSENPAGGNIFKQALKIHVQHKV